MKKVVVIGGGIAGLSAGIYTQKCGFSVTVVERNDIAGGICTSWKRNGYLFEGGMHWLAGSSPKSAVNKAWRYVGALDDSVTIRFPEPFLEYSHNGTPIRLYRNVETTERELLRLAPEDAKEIKEFCSNIRKIKNLDAPLIDIRGVKVTKKNPPPLSIMLSGISAMRLIMSLAGTTRDQYISRFSNKGLRELIRSITADDMGIAPFFFSFGSLNSGDGGFPEGGSLPFVNRMVKKFTGLGGKLLLNTSADKVIVERNKAVGVQVGDKRLVADAVIVTSDTMLVDRLFDIPLKSKWLDEMQANTSPSMAVFVCLGIDADLRKYPVNGMYKLNRPIQLAAETYEYIGAGNYANDPNYSPAGKTAMTMQFPGDTYDYWKKLKKEEGRYDQEKQRFGKEVVAALTERIPEMEGKVEVCDIATPLTYERYCANWKGSWMTKITKEMKVNSYPSVIDGLNGVYFAGHRMTPPGGMPVALISGRTAVQYLCRDTGAVFVSEE